MDPSALRARFAYTGAGILLIVATSVGCFLLALFLIRTIREAAPTGGRRVLRVAMAAVVALLPLAAVTALLRWEGQIPFANSSLYGRAFALWVNAVVGGGAALAATAALFRQAPRPGKRVVPRWIAVLALSTYGLVFLAFYSALVSRHLYPVMPEQFGGGRPQAVRLLLSRDGSELAPRLGLPMCGGPPVSCRVSVIWRGEDFIAVRTPSREVVELDKSLVLGARPASNSGTSAAASQTHE